MFAIVLNEVVNKLKIQHEIEEEASGFMVAGQAVVDQIRNDYSKIVHLAAYISLRHGDAAATDIYEHADRIRDQLGEANGVMFKTQALYLSNHGSITSEQLKQIGLCLDQIQCIYKSTQLLINRA